MKSPTPDDLDDEDAGKAKDDQPDTYETTSW